VEIVSFKVARVKGLSAGEIAERVKIAFALESYALEQTLPTLTEEELDRAGELASRLFPASDINAWHAQMSQLLGILFGAKHWPVLFDLIMRNRMAARRYTEILVRRTIEDPKWATGWAAGYFPRMVELLRRGDLEDVKSLQRERFKEYIAQLLPWLAAGTEPSKPKRGGLRTLKKITSARGRKKSQSPTRKG
jgi:DNA-binding GntR family transcriptional regulator